jgi:hypothetical protein
MSPEAPPKREPRVVRAVYAEILQPTRLEDGSEVLRSIQAFRGSTVYVTAEQEVQYDLHLMGRGEGVAELEAELAQTLASFRSTRQSIEAV